MTLATFIQASAHQLDGIADGSVQAIVTSPPYYGLRAYAGEQGVEWPAVEYAPMPGLPTLTVPAMRSPLGNEPTLEAYIGHLVLCLREWRRVLRDDGICFVNLGDSFSGSGGAGGDYNEGGLRAGQPKFKAGKSNGLKPKDLMMVPARFALAAQADGWWLRSDIIAAKIAPMPESVQDRFTRSHEHIFMLTKRAKYFFDAEAIKETAKNEGKVVQLGAKSFSKGQANGAGIAPSGNGAADTYTVPAGRNCRDVIEWRPAPFSGSHFAVFPEAIPEKLIRAATSERGACPHCGAPWRRVVEKIMPPLRKTESAGPYNGHGLLGGNRFDDPIVVNTTGFEPSCACAQHEPVPCVVLDPFSGSGTTCKVAVRLGRRALGVDIAAEYLDDVTALRFGAGVQMELTGTL
jgi:DNA modification methylase